VLAAFLLGESLEVETRHLGASPGEAIRFSASLDTDTISLRHIQRDECGTTIRVAIDAEIYKQLVSNDGVKWDWYRLCDPRVQRIVTPPGCQLRELTRVPGSGEELPPWWHRISVPGYEDVQWTYSRLPSVLCNGIVVGNCSITEGYSTLLR